MYQAPPGQYIQCGTAVFLKCNHNTLVTPTRISHAKGQPFSPAHCSWEVGFLQELNPTTSFAGMSRGREIRDTVLLKVGEVTREETTKCPPATSFSLLEPRK